MKPVSFAVNSFKNGPLSVEQLAEFKKFHGQPVTHLPRAVLRHDPGKLKTFADLLRPRVRRGAQKKLTYFFLSSSVAVAAL
jgi:hypothetical protein